MRKNNQILNFLGRGGAFNPKEGNNSAYIKEEDTLFLIDCGEDTFGRLIKTELITNIKNLCIYITHLHSDHYSSLSTLLYYAKFICNIKPIVYTADERLQTIL